MKIRMMSAALLAAGAAALFVAPEASAGAYIGAVQAHVPGQTTVAPGKLVLFIGKCRTTDFDAVGALSSPLFGSLPLESMQNMGGDVLDNAIWSTKIKAGAKAGTYPVSFLCNGKKVSGSIKIAAKTAAPAKQVTVKPKGAPQTGDGSSIA